jgi:hypothetical protein
MDLQIPFLDSFRKYLLLHVSMFKYPDVLFALFAVYLIFVRKVLLQIPNTENA